VQITEEQELAYIAGIIDGEGCFTMAQDKSCKTVQYHCRIQLEMTDFDAVLRVHTVFPGRMYGPYDYSKRGRKPTMRWVLNKQVDVFNCLLKIRPYLSARRLQRSGELFDYLEPKVVK